ncbi:MAG: hypothetical protein ACQ9MH_14615 [Nitrospinales bacterium]
MFPTPAPPDSRLGFAALPTGEKRPRTGGSFTSDQAIDILITRNRLRVPYAALRVLRITHPLGQNILVFKIFQPNQRLDGQYLWILD